jgi:hypothetical protein
MITLTNQQNIALILATICGNRTTETETFINFTSKKPSHQWINSTMRQLVNLKVVAINGNGFILSDEITAYADKLYKTDKLLRKEVDNICN